MLQAHLTAGDTIAEAGLSAQPKAAKPKQAHEATCNHPLGQSVWATMARYKDHGGNMMAKSGELPGRYFAAPEPPTASEAEGMEWGRALARRYLPEDVRHRSHAVSERWDHYNLAASLEKYGDHLMTACEKNEPLDHRVDVCNQVAAVCNLARTLKALRMEDQRSRA